MNAKPLPLSCEDCGGREGGAGGAVYGSLVVINSFALLNERGSREGEGFRRFNCFAIRASEPSLFRGEDHIANFERGNANMFTTASTW